MTINAKIGSFEYEQQRARNIGQWPAIILGAFTASQGVLPAGLLLTKASGGYEPYKAVAAEAVGIGTGSVKAYTKTLASLPICPGTVVVSDGVETFADDGLGRLVGSAGGTGTIYYATGALAVSFNANVVNTTPITANYETALDAILDEDLDTAVSLAAPVILAGPVTQGVLKVGASAKVAPSAALLARLRKQHLYAV